MDTTKLSKFSSLYVYDVSAIINSGAKSFRSSKWNVNGFPTGGLYKLLGYIIKDYKEEIKTASSDNHKFAIVLCLDSDFMKSWRLKNYPKYKGTRNRELEKELAPYMIGDYSYTTSGCDVENSQYMPEVFSLFDMPYDIYSTLSSSAKSSLALKWSVRAQIEFIKKFLVNIIPDILLYEGVEADDLIYSVAASYPNVNKFTLRADDEDLFDVAAFQENAEMQSVSGKGNKFLYPLRGSLSTKYLNGCTSDNIPSIVKLTDIGFFVNIVHKSILLGKLNPMSVKKLNTLDITPIMELGISGITEEIARTIALNLYLVYPFLFTVQLSGGTIKLDGIVEVLSVLKMTRLLKTLGSDYIYPYTNSMKEMASYMRNVPYYFKDYLGDAYYSHQDSLQKNSNSNAMNNFKNTLDNM